MSEIEIFPNLTTQLFFHQICTGCQLTTFSKDTQNK